MAPGISGDQQKHQAIITSHSTYLFLVLKMYNQT